ncbi:phage tail protein [Pseudonocardia hydrocarbonoxydans]|uniref:phage tail protein n=1 Tax=Pseudonocardia hydrocarbonoxydans TaxID=76726 RepID=UPI0011421D40|nr:hypothetical protein [Pseudonocardia hydrocarbonoxydans]
MPDTDRLRQGLETAVRQASAGVVAQVRVQWVPAAAVLRAELQRLADAAARGVRADIEVSADASGLRNAMRALTGSSGGGGPGRVLAGLSRSFSVLTRSVAGLAAAGSAVQVIGGLSAALAQLAPIALALPGLLLGVGAAFAAVKIGLSGVGEAIKTGDLSGLAGPAAESVTALRSLKPALDDLKSSVQGALFEGLAGPLREAGTTLLPILKTGLTGISTEFNGIAKSALAATQSPFFQDDLTQILGNTAGMLGNMRDSLGNLLSGFVGLGGVGSTYLPALGNAIDNVASKFKAWVDQGVEDGSIKAMIDGAIQGFNDLGAVLGNIGSSIGSVFSGLQAGMGGAGLLSNLVALTDQVARFMETAAAQDALRSLGELMATAGTAVREILGAALQALAPIVSALAPLISAFATALSSALVPILESVGPPIARLVEAFANGLAPILPLLASAFAQLGPIVGTLIDALVPVVSMLAETMLPVFEMLLPLVVDIADALGSALATAIQSVAPFIPPLVQAVSDVLAAVLPLIPKILELAQIVFPLLVGIIGSVVVPAIQLIAGIITNVLVPVVSGVIDVILFLARIFTMSWSDIDAVVRDGVAIVSGLLGQMIDFVGTIPSRVVSVLGNLGSLLVNSGRAMIDGFVTGIRNAIGSAISAVSGFIGRIRNLFPFSPAKDGPLSGRGYVTHSGKALTRDFAKSLRKGAAVVQRAAAGVVSGVESEFAGVPLAIGAIDAAVDRMKRVDMNSDIRASVTSDDFGIDYDRLADSVVNGLTGSTLNVEGNGMAKIVNKSNTRKARRR